jgi:hypothetical protein
MLARQLGLYHRPEIRCNWCGKNQVYHWYKEHCYVCTNTFCPYLLRHGQALHLDAKSDYLKYNFWEEEKAITVRNIRANQQLKIRNLDTVLQYGFKSLDFREGLAPKLNHKLGYNTHNIVNRFL